MKLSLIVPAYNEESTLEDLIDKVLTFKLYQDFEKEIIIVNDGSKDKTWEVMLNLSKKYPNIKSFQNEKNSGKSQTVKNGIQYSTGDYLVIQDADLEYEPSDISKMLELLLLKKLDVVYGNRFGKRNKVIYLQNYVGNLLLSVISNIFTFPRIKTWIPDMEVCYKLMKGDIAREIGKGIVSKSTFGLEPEITAKLSRYKIKGSHLKFAVFPVSYYPRSIAEGKKMHAFRDGIKALKEIIKFNL